MYRTILRQPYKSPLQRILQQQHYQQYSSGLPQNVREAGFGKVIVILSPLIAIGGTITYANYDKNFRKLLEDNVPGADYVLKIALQEEKPFKTIRKYYTEVSESVKDVSTTVSDFFGGSSEKPVTPKSKINLDSLMTSDKKSEPATATTPIAKSSSSPAIKDTTATPSSSKPVAKLTPTAPVQHKKEEKLPTEILELEKAVEVAAALAVKEYNKAINVLKSFNDDVTKVVDRAVENVDTSLWITLKNKTSARDSSVSMAEKLAREAIDKIEKCEVALSKAAHIGNADEVLAIRNKIKIMMEHINNVKDELYKSKDSATLSEKYWKSVERARNYFIDEIESIFPGLNLNEKKINLSKEDLDLFIMHAYSHVVSYQKEVQRLQTEGELRLKRAVEAVRGDNDQEAVKAQVEYLLEAEKRKLNLENQRKIFQIRTESDKQLRQMLKQQSEAHVDHLKDAISLKEAELKRNYNLELETKLESEKANYKLQLATMLGKMRGMDAALQARADAERSAHQAQALWAACQALWSSVKSGEPGISWKEKLRPLKNEIKAIATVAEGDELVAVVLRNLPREAEERGVFPEDALRDRFNNVERIARKVAIVPETGAGIPTYILSYLQSLFVMQPSNPISDIELLNQQFDYSKLDTYEILNRARFFVDRGDLIQALKYMNLLQGASRKVANDWLKETRLLLETQQAANTLMAHAAASGLLYL